MKDPKMDIVVDLQFGSTGKGLLSSYLGVNNHYDAAVSANMMNAGHTAYAPDTGQKFVHKVLPSAIFGKSLEVIAVGPGSAFFIDRIEEEWKAVCDYRKDLTLVIHEAACIARPEHKAAEAATLSRIASTMQGSAEAFISKVRREPGAIAGNNVMQLTERLSKHGRVRVVDQGEWLKIFNNKENILLEGSQGFSLGISSGFYPYCTSRDCTPARVISDCSMPIGWLRNIYGSARVHPIRVGNTPDGHSGDWYPDQTEIHFSDLGVPDETTTVTGRVRRIATFSEEQMYQALMTVQPDAVFMNFVNYNEHDSENAITITDRLAREIGCGGVELIGMGPKIEDVFEVGM